MTTPQFSAVRDAVLARLQSNIGNHQNKLEITQDIDTLFKVIGDINMAEDRVFAVDGIPHVIDFKSGFGSNEKGNMLRLQTVGRAYRMWNHQTKLLLLVRQERNNNYLNTLRRTALWEVHTGTDAYNQMTLLTGANFQVIRDSVINWEADLSPDFYQYLKRQPTDLTSYLSW